jgi:hypothetical protein
MFTKTKDVFITLWLFCFLSSCTKPSGENNILLKAVYDKDPSIKRVIDSLGQYEIQILYTQIDRDKENNPVFTDYEFQVSDSVYFYPASTVKFPVAVLALEKLNEGKKYGGNTRFYLEGDSVETSFYKEINKIFAVSDNDAYNRLFEFMGTDDINKKLKEKALTPIRISHRLSTPDAFNTKTKSLVIYLNDTTVTQTQSTINRAPQKLGLKNINKGRGFYEADSLIMKPFDFSEKNYIPLRTLHNIMKRVIFPEKYGPDKIFKLDANSRAFLLKAMHSTPSKSGYDPAEYYDSYGKFFMFGDKKDSIPPHIKIYNKVGYAYGTLTDCAYIHDTKNQVEFLLSATILVNKNGIFNDNIYEYETVGIPFLAALGRNLYQQELNRK